MAEGPAEQTARAKSLIAERKYDEAIRVCRRVLLTRPDVVEVRLLLGQALLATARYEQVRVEMMALARKQPNLAELHRILGEAYLRSGQSAKARTSLERAVELDPADEVARDLLSEASDEDVAPVSETIERWFGDDEPKTVEQQLPPSFEDVTPVPRRAPLVTDEPSIQVDPDLALEAAALRAPRGASRLAQSPIVPRPIAAPPTAVGARRVPARKPTITGVASPLAATGQAETNAGRGRPPAMFDDDDDTTFGRASQRVDAPITDEIELPDDVAPQRAASRAAPVEQHDEEDEDEPTLLGRRPGSLAPPPAAHAPQAFAPRASSTAPLAPPPGRPSARSVPPPPAAPPRAAPPRSVPPPASMAPPPPARPPAAVAPPAARPVSITVPQARRSSPDARPPAAVETAPRASPIMTSGAFDAAVTAPRPFLGGAPPASSPRAVEPKTDPRREPPRAEATTDATRRPRSSALSPKRIAIGGAAAVLVLVIGIFGARAFLRGRADDAIRAAASTASGDGRRSSFERALAAIDENGADEPWRVALRARLLATLTLEHADDHSTEVEAALAALGREGAALPDARVARSLLLVSRGRGADALGVLSGLAASGDELAEAFRARAWAAATSGRITDAEESARQALAARPRTPRHASLEAVLRHQAGDAAGALEVLESVPNASTSPAVRVARARILLDSGGDPAAAAAEADGVLTELAPSASPVELGWAHLVRARLAASRRDLPLARSEAEQAAQRTPRFDEAYGLAVAETLLTAGAIDGARAALAGLPEATVDPTRRASLAAEVALAGNDLAGAESALIAAGSGAHADLLRGRLREGHGDLEAARQLYERAAADAREALSARTRAGAVLLRLARPRDARVQLEHALRLAPDDPEAVTLFVRAALAVGDASAADAALSSALAARPDSVDLVAARGSVLLALGRVDEALASLEQACQARPEDAGLRVELGEAALRGGRREAAASAFQEALRLDAGLARAHLGIAQLTLEEARFDEAAAAIDRAVAGSAAPVDVAHLRAELAVARGLGAGAFQAVQQLLTQHARDPRLLAALGILQSQAEEDRDARETFTRALRADDENPEALLGRAAVETRRGDLGGAARSIDRAERAGRQRGASPSFTARVAVARARLRFEVNDFTDARRLAEQAIATDAHCGEAHLLLAILAEEGDGDPIPHLRSAIAGTHTPAEATGLLAPRVSGDEACALARRYVAAAPDGFDRDDVDRVLRRCR